MTRRLTDDLINHAAKLYTEQGLSMAKIAIQIGCHEETIRKKLKTIGVNVSKNHP